MSDSDHETSGNTSGDSADSTGDALGRVSDEQEQQESSSTQDGPAAEGDYDPAQGSPDAGSHPVGEDFPEEAVRFDEPDRRRPAQD